MLGRAAVLSCLLTLSGCGPRAGDTFHCPHALIYYDLKDADLGGDRGRDYELMRQNRIKLVSQCGLRVLEPRGDWTKVKVMAGSNEGVTGWVETSSLRDRSY